AGQSIVAGLQFWRQDDLGLYWLGEVDLNRYPGGGSILAVGEQFWLRAYGLTNHPNLLGGFLALAILLLLGGSLRPGRLAWPLRLGLLLGCAALVLSFSRAAWLGLLAGFLFLALLLGSRAAWRQQYGRSLLLGAAFCCVGGLLALIPTRELLFTRLQPTVNEFETRSLSERDALQAAAWVAYGAAPWTGVGAGNGTVAVAPLIGEQAAVAPQPVHQVPLLLLLELGPAGAALWLLLMILPPGYTLYLCWRQPERVTPWLLALSAALLAYGLIDFYDYYAWGWAPGRHWRWLLWAFWSLAVSYRPVDARSDYDNAVSTAPDPGDPRAQNR
ncbi:MAG: O-antigen ligase family protein, partial [Anaerolineales bacterium]|nr:O-antigen ligase family protein [Anaerolineales bacterium]